MVKEYFHELKENILKLHLPFTRISKFNEIQTTYLDVK